MANQGYSSDFVGPVQPQSYTPPANNFTPSYTFFTPTMQNFAATAFAPPAAAAPKITYEAPPQVSFPSSFQADGQKKNWAVEVLMPSYNSIKPIVTPPIVFQPSSLLSDTMQSQVRQATSKVSEQVISGINSRVGSDAVVLDFLKPIISVSPQFQGSFTIEPDKLISGNYKDRTLYLENVDRANAYRKTIGAPTLETHEWKGRDYFKPLGDYKRGRYGQTSYYMSNGTEDGNRFVIASISTRHPVQVIDSPRGQWTANVISEDSPVGRSATIFAPISLATQIEAKTEWLDLVSTLPRSSRFNGYLPLSPQDARFTSSNIPTAEQMAGETLRHEVSHHLWGSTRPMRSTLYGLREANPPAGTDNLNLSAATYPEYSFAEYGPPVDAIQREYLRQSGGTQRIETPEQYQNFMQKYQNLTPEQINALPVSQEFKRALLYRVYSPDPPTIDRSYQYLLPGSLGRNQPTYNFVPATV